MRVEAIQRRPLELGRRAPVGDRLATRVIVDEALEGEAGDAVGREYYAHGAQPGQGYRNGCCTGRLKTTEGLMEYSAPQIARIWPSRCWRALSVRDIEDALMGAS